VYIVAIFFPPIAVLLCGKPFQAILNFVLCCTLVLAVVAIIHACFVVKACKEEERNRDRQEFRQDMAVIMAATRQPAPPPPGR
jgi:uncharacterized membrane protein YqaE (UPF0057 family)